MENFTLSREEYDRAANAIRNTYGMIKVLEGYRKDDISCGEELVFVGVALGYILKELDGIIDMFW